jgi:hypothetical protein
MGPFRRALLCVVVSSGPLAAPAIAQPGEDARTTPIEIGVSASYDVRRNGTADVPGGAGSIVAAAVNVDRHGTIVTEVAHSPRAHSVMVGVRARTGFSRESGTGLPTRLFGEALVGRNAGGAAAAGAAMQLGAGADLIVVPRGLALRVAVHYLFTQVTFTRSEPQNFAGTRVSVGFVVGPHRAR